MSKTARYAEGFPNEQKQCRYRKSNEWTGHVPRPRLCQCFHYIYPLDLLDVIRCLLRAIECFNRFMRAGVDASRFQELRKIRLGKAVHNPFFHLGQMHVHTRRCQLFVESPERF